MEQLINRLDTICALAIAGFLLIFIVVILWNSTNNRITVITLDEDGLHIESKPDTDEEEEEE